MMAARATSGVLYIGNTNVVILDRLTLASTGAFVNDATVTVTIKDSDDVNLVGQSWPVTLAYVTSSDGKYSGAISKDVTVSAGDRLSAEVTAVSSGITGFWDAPVVVRNRIG